MKFGPSAAFACVGILFVLAVMNETETPLHRRHFADIRILLGLLFHLVAFALMFKLVDGRWNFLTTNKLALLWLLLAALSAVMISSDSNESTASIYLWVSASIVAMYIIYSYNTVLSSLCRLGIRMSWTTCEKTVAAIISLPGALLTWLSIRSQQRNCCN